MKKYATALAITLLLTACSSPDYVRVSEADYNDDWPFEGISEGLVICYETAVAIKLNDEKYSLNGSAKTQFDYPYPYEEGIVKEIPLFPEEPDVGSINADPSFLMKVCE